MKFKIANLLALPLLMAAMAFADTGTTYYPYAVADLQIYNNHQILWATSQWDNLNQFWDPAQMVTLKVSAGTSVYLTNYVSSWEGFPDLGASNYEAGYNMAQGKYGYVIAQHVTEVTEAEDGTVVTKDKVTPTTKADGSIDIHYGNGETKNITYLNPDENEIRYKSVTTTGYLLDTFYNDTEIFFVMTPNGVGYDETINSYDPVVDRVRWDHQYPSDLASRQINTTDIAGNVRVNFGTVKDYNEDEGDDPIWGHGVGHEFVIATVAAPPTKGQPLPGMLLCGMLCFGTATAASKMRKRSSK